MQSSVTLTAGQSCKVGCATITFTRGGTRERDGTAVSTAELEIDDIQAGCHNNAGNLHRKNPRSSQEREERKRAVTLAAGESFAMHGATITFTKGGTRKVTGVALPTAELGIESRHVPTVNGQPTSG